MYMTFTAFGLQRSGTNFIERCIFDNFKDVSCLNNDDNYIWKHGYGFNSDKLKPEHIHIYIYKNPYMWLQSIFRSPVDIKDRYPDVTKQTVNMRDGLNVDALAKLWSQHILFWFSDAIKPCVDHYVSYEKLIESDEATLIFLNRLNLTKKEKIAIPKKVFQSRPFTESIRKDYLEGKIEKDIPPGLVGAFGDNLDKTALKLTGWQDFIPGYDG